MTRRQNEEKTIEYSIGIQRQARKMRKTHDSENLTTKLWVGMSAALATSLSVMAFRGVRKRFGEHLMVEAHGRCNFISKLMTDIIWIYHLTFDYGGGHLLSNLLGPASLNDMVGGGQSTFHYEKLLPLDDHNIVHTLGSHVTCMRGMVVVFAASKC